MNRRKRTLAIAVVLAVSIGGPALGAVSNLPHVGVVFQGKGKQPGNTSLEMLVDVGVKASSAVCWIYTREGKPKNNAQVRGEITIVRPSGPDEVVGPLASAVGFRPSFNNAIGCGCGMSQLAIAPGDTVRGDFKLKRVGKLKATEGATLVVWVFDGVQIPGGTLVDCAQFFPGAR